MFKIYGNRNEFFQWDLNQKLIIGDPTITQVHYCNRTDDCALVVEVYELDGLRVADVPNILLQDNWPIRAYAYCGEGYTLVEHLFNVKRRSRPSDYVYTETEVRTWEALERKMDQLVVDAVNDYIVSTLNTEVA